MDSLVSIVQLVVYIIVLGPIKFFFRPQIRHKVSESQLRRGIVFISNHQSRMDTFLIFTSLSPRSFARLVPMYGLIAEKYMNTWWKKIALSCFGGFPVRAGAKETARSLLFMLDKITQQRSILIFPEGRVMTNGEISRAHPGIGYLALKQNIDIIPVHLSGFINVGFKKMLQRGYRAKVVFGQIQNFYGHKALRHTDVSLALLRQIYKLS